ncbi:hypothetical protein ACTXT7_013516 [Hymenolepis weldensis]
MLANISLNGTHGVAERTGQGAVPDFTLDSRNVESHSSIYECLEKQVLPLTIGWLRQISGLKLQPRKLHKPNLNEARIWQQNEGIGFVRKHKCQCQEMLEKVNFECKDLENKDEINVVTKTADEVCKKQRWAVGKVQRRYEVAKVNWCGKLVKRKEVGKQWLTKQNSVWKSPESYAACKRWRSGKNLLILDVKEIWLEESGQNLQNFKLLMKAAKPTTYFEKGIEESKMNMENAA